MPLLSETSPPAEQAEFQATNVQNRWNRKQNLEQAKYTGYQVTGHIP